MGIRRINQGIKRHPSPSSLPNSYDMAAGQSRRFIAWAMQQDGPMGGGSATDPANSGGVVALGFWQDTNVWDDSAPWRD